MLDAKVRGQVDDFHPGFEQISRLRHRGSVRGREKHQVAIPVALHRRLAELKVDLASQVRKLVRDERPRLRAGGDQPELRARMPRQQTHQFHPGIPGAADYSNPDHLIVHTLTLK